MLQDAVQSFTASVMSKVPKLSAIPWAKNNPQGQKDQKKDSAPPKLPWLNAPTDGKGTAQPEPTRHNASHSQTSKSHTRIDKQKAGRHHEQKARQHLEAQGLLTLHQNLHFHWGEIDLIMSDRDTAVIVEVRSRSKTSLGKAIETLGYQKQRHINRCAMLWWKREGQYKYESLRFDVVTFDGHNPKPVWFKNAWHLEV